MVTQADIAIVRIRQFTLDRLAAIGRSYPVFASRQPPAGWDVGRNPPSASGGPYYLVYMRGGPKDFSGRVRECDVVFEAYATTEYLVTTMAEVDLCNALDMQRGQYVVQASEDSAPTVSASSAGVPMAIVSYTIQVRIL